MGGEGNRRGEGNRGLVYYYENCDGDGNGNGNCVRKRGVGQGGGGGDGRMGLFLLFVFIFDTKLSLQKWTEAERRKEEDVLSSKFMLFYFVVVSFVSPFLMQVD